MGGAFHPRNHPDYLEYEDMSREISEALTQMRMEGLESIAAVNVPKIPVIRLACWAITTPDAKGCCEYRSSSVGR